MEDSQTYHKVIKKLRAFFEGKGFVEVPAQTRRSILAACEDPRTISTYSFSGEIWPLPQTGQMWLEYELLKNPELEGVFCITTSYRDEPNPIQGRHDFIFPMFEFEAKGDIEKLKALETELLRFLGFTEFKDLDYESACAKYGVQMIESAEEAKIASDFGSAIFLQHFPERTSPFWNMKNSGQGIYGKVDVLLQGMETIGSAERSCNTDEMRMSFETISDGEYAELLFDKFGRERVLKELEDYFSLKMFPRFGGGIGVTRMARAMKMEGLI